MEESKTAVQSSQAHSSFISQQEQDRKFKARVNNNAGYDYAQKNVFANITKVDRLIAYSMNSNCQSISQMKQQQILSLISRFNMSNHDSNINKGKEAFKNIIKNRFNQQQVNNQEEDIIAEDDFEIDEDNDDNDGDHELESEESSVGEVAQFVMTRDRQGQEVSQSGESSESDSFDEGGSQDSI